MSSKIDLMSTPFVFVYGTLKRGGSNNRLLSSSKFITVAESVTESHLFNLGGFPCWNPTSPLSDALRAPVRGEIWEVTEEDLKRLDRLEGHPDFFYRSQMNFVHDYKTYRAWVYFLEEPHATNLCPIVKGAYEWNTNTL